jgi:hypothetical protein
MTDYPRALTEREAAVIARLVAVQPAPLRAIYEAQAATAQVESACGCGRPTIDLTVDASRAPRAGDDPRWEIANAQSPVGPIILVVSEGWLECLELLYWDGPTAPTAFPDAETLAPSVRLEP